jgi:hypothetical protein
MLLRWILMLACLTSATMAQDAPKPTLPPGDSISEKLKKSDGVVKPPEDVDPQIKVMPPKPDPNSTPVIPPPGTPQNRPDLDPR